jgi:hypothetical protein
MLKVIITVPKYLIQLPHFVFLKEKKEGKKGRTEVRKKQRK